MRAAEFIHRLRAHPARDIALIGARSQLDYGALAGEIDAFAAQLAGRGVRVLATQLDNGIAWAIADLAALAAGVVHVPLPAFFTPAMRSHAMQTAGADSLLTDAHATPAAGAGADAPARVSLGGEQASLARCTREAAAMPAGTAKITFTSGSTGTPKGVCLSADAQLVVADGIAQALAPLRIQRHLCALPLPVLLENIAGLYAPLLAGATVVVPPAATVGMRGAAGFDPRSLQFAIERHAVESVITLPQMLRLWTGWRAAAAACSDRLRFVAVGGARVGAALISQARHVGLPAYEGYGLSEGASVQTLNLPQADRPGSAGRLLPHARMRIADSGEIEIAGALMLGYAGSQARIEDGWWPTGDLGEIDADGFVHVHGRRKTLLITAYGRNVSPEWVESALQSQPAIAHAVVFGDGEAALWAVIWPTHDALPDAAVAAAIDTAARELPDYARPGSWVRAAWPFSHASGLATANGRPQRAAIAALAVHAPRRAIEAEAAAPTPAATVSPAGGCDAGPVFAGSPVIRPACGASPPPAPLFLCTSAAIAPPIR